MNKNKVKFKYILGLWKSLPEYPTKEDVIYEMSVYLVKDNRPNGEFSHQTFNSVFGSTWEKTKHGEVIKSMIVDGDFEEVNKNTGTKKWYKIKSNPYYN